MMRIKVLPDDEMCVESATDSSTHEKRAKLEIIIIIIIII